MDPAHSQLSVTANRAPAVLEREQDKPHFSHPTALKSSLGKCAVRSGAQKRHSQQQGALGSQPPGHGVGRPAGSGVDRDVGCPQTVNYDPMVEIFMEKRKNLTLHIIKYSSNYIYIYVCVYVCIHICIFSDSFLLFVTDAIVVQLCPTLYSPMDCSTPGFPVLHNLPELAHTHVH